MRLFLFFLSLLFLFLFLLVCSCYSCCSCLFLLFLFLFMFLFVLFFWMLLCCCWLQTGKESRHSNGALAVKVDDSSFDTNLPFPVQKPPTNSRTLSKRSPTGYRLKICWGLLSRLSLPQKYLSGWDVLLIHQSANATGCIVYITGRSTSTKRTEVGTGHSQRFTREEFQKMKRDRYWVEAIVHRTPHLAKSYYTCLDF